MITTLPELIDRLRQNPRVWGLVRYGGREVDDDSQGGDFDLFVLMHTPTDGVESLHFYVDGIPVDLNLRSWEDLELDEPLTPIDTAIADGEILYDGDGDLPSILLWQRRHWQQAQDTPTEHDTAWERFCQQHVLDKVRGRLESEPLLCEFLLNTNIYWLVQAAFRVRQVPYPGEKHALLWLEAHEPAMHALIEQFYAAPDLQAKVALTERLTAIALAPIGGPWRSDEVIAFGTERDIAELQTKGQALFQELFEP